MFYKNDAPFITFNIFLQKKTSCFSEAFNTNLRKIKL